MRFQVPQFIDVEDKIVGPFTFKQFIYMAGGFGICAVLFNFLPTFVAVILCIPVIAFSVALAFYKPNSKPFVDQVEAFFSYIISSRLYVWKKEDKVPVMRSQNEQRPNAQVYVPKLSESKLKDLSFNLDVLGPKTENDEDKL